MATAVCFVLHSTGLLPYIYSIPVVVIDIAGSILAVLVTVALDIRRKKLDYPLIAIGMGIFFVSGLASIPGLMQGSGNMEKNIILLGLLALAIFAVLKAVLDAEKAKQEKKEALMLSDSKSRFLASMSHEIRTPINTVLGMNEMIERECNDDTILSYADNIGTAGRMLLSIINDILDFSKIESGKMELTEVSYQTASVINDCVTLLKKRADSKGLAMILSCDRNLPAALIGDDVRVKQIITNILTNAVKYTEKGSVTLTVTGERIPPEEQQNEKNFLLQVSVKDTGIGIKKEAMGDLEQNTAAVQTEKKKYEPSFTAPEARVLVVDDNKMNRMVFKALLKQTGMQIDQAAGGLEAIEMTRKQKYNIIFMDHMMPDLDGIETLKRLRAEDKNPNRSTTTIALTANAIAGIDRMYRDSGFQDYLAKPVQPIKLERMVISYLPKDLVKKK